MPTNGNVWKNIEGLEERLRELVHSGALVKERGSKDKDGIGRVFKTLNAEFGAQLKSSGYRLTEQSLKKKLSSLVWTKEVEDLIKAVVYNHRPISEFLEHCPWIPEYMAAKKYREFGGATGTPKTAEFKAGFGRIAGAIKEMGAEGFMLSKGTYDNPIELEVNQGDTVLITGKGTNHSIFLAGGKEIPWDDASVVREELSSLLKAKVTQSTGGIMNG